MTLPFVKPLSSPEPRILCLRMTRGSGKLCRKTRCRVLTAKNWLFAPYDAYSLLVLTSMHQSETLFILRHENQFALVTRRPYCPGRPKKLCFTTPSLTPMVSAARLGVVKQSFFGLLGQYGRRVTRANEKTLCFTVSQSSSLPQHA